MPFILDTTTDTGKVRLLIGDTDETAPNFSDDSIVAFIAIASDTLYLAASIALRSWARQLTQVDEKMGDYQIDYSKVSANMVTLADKYETLNDETPAIGIAQINLSVEGELDLAFNWFARNAPTSGPYGGGGCY